MKNLKGKRVRLIRTEDPYSRLVKGDEGRIDGVDRNGELIVNWSKGFHFNLSPKIDEYTVLESRHVKKFKEFRKYGI